MIFVGDLDRSIRNEDDEKLRSRRQGVGWVEVDALDQGGKIAEESHQEGRGLLVDNPHAGSM
jgi:hypothetical protein